MDKRQTNDALICLKDLVITSENGQLLVDHISLQLNRGETLGLVGESGSGKTMTLKSLMGLLPDGIREDYKLKEVNGNAAMIFQNPMSALDPLCPVFSQLTEIIRLRQNINRQNAKKQACKLLERLGLPDALSERDRLPSELSGGQCQRILIAIALACRPDVLLCDEPTTALDVTIQKQTLDLIRSLQKEMNFAILFVTHNLAVAAGLCSRLAVMQKGRIVEEGKTEQLLVSPQNAYTRLLLSSILPVPIREQKNLF